MTTATHTNLTMSMEAFLKMPGNEHYEWMHGEAIPMAENPLDHAMIIFNAARLIGNYVYDHQLGAGCTESAHYLVTLADGTQAIRQADVSFIAGDDPKAIRRASPHVGGPDLAVEVTSEYDSPGAVQAKVRMWLDNGTRCVWQVGHDRRVTIHRSGQVPVVLGPEDELAGEPVLRGFRVGVGELYA